jgi:hypothetical protein
VKHERRSIPTRDGAMRIVAVADTHSNPHPLTKTRIEELKPDHLVHAGDIGDLSVLEGLRALAPLSAVRGNIDVRANEVPDVLTLDLTDGDRTLITILLLHIAVYGPKLRADVAKLARKEGASLVLCGHSHVPFLGRDKGITVFNPGSIGPRRMHLPIVFGVVEITRERVSLRHVDCATGETWLPPGM